MGRAGGAPRAQAAGTNDAAAAAGEADAAAITIVAAAAMMRRGRRGPRHRRRPLVVVIIKSEMEYCFVSSERTIRTTVPKVGGRGGDDGCRPWAEGIDAAAVAWGWWGGYSSSGTMARVPAEAAEVHSTIKPGVRFKRRWGTLESPERSRLAPPTSLRTPKFTSDRRSRARDGEA